MINCSNIKVYMDRCMIGTFWHTVEVAGSLAVCRVQVLSFLSIRKKNAKPLPSQFHFTIAVCHCVRGYCFELHLSVFHSNSLQNEVSGLCLVSLSAHIGLWSIWGICDRGVIDNHVIPCSNTVRERTIQEQCQKHPKIRFYMQSKHYFTSPTAAKCTKQANLLMKDNIDILHILLHAC